MSFTSTIMTSYTRSVTDIVVAETFTELPSSTTSETGTIYYHKSSPTDHARLEKFVQIYVVTSIPFTCENTVEFRALESSWDPHLRLRASINPNPDIAGRGIIVAFFVTAGSVVLLALVAYTGGFLPAHFLHRIDKQIFKRNSRNEHSKWREAIESIMMSLSDQQLVTGFAILVAGYYEMFNTGTLSLYHWQVVVYLAWLSSSVHIASLTLLKDVFNKNTVLRNLRVAGMLVLLILLTIAMWPTRIRTASPLIPVRCLWTLSEEGSLDPDWVLSIAMMLIAYIWKLSQLFASSRGWIRKWTVAKPEAAIERLLRRISLCHLTIWLRWPAYKILTICYITFVAYAELAESFAASIMYLCLAFSYGVSIIIRTRQSVDDEVLADESRLTFGQLVPLFMLFVPVLLLFELSFGTHKTHEAPGAIYSLVNSGFLRPKPAIYPNLTTALSLNEPSRSECKLRIDGFGQHDPIIDHLMSSKVVKCAIWIFVIGLMGLGFAIASLNPDARIGFLIYGGAPGLAAVIPLVTLFALPFSRRLR